MPGLHHFLDWLQSDTTIFTGRRHTNFSLEPPERGDLGTVSAMVMPPNRNNPYICAPVTEITGKIPTAPDNTNNAMNSLPDSLSPNKAQPFICIPSLS